MDIPVYEIASAAIIFMLGASFGSFVTLASYRLPREMGVLWGRSICPVCESKLRAKDLIPLLSWLVMRGKCRYCEAKISPRYPLIELLLGVSFVYLYLQYGVSLLAVLLGLFVTTLAIMLVSDIETGLLPDETQIALLLLGIAYHYLLQTSYVVPLGGMVTGLAVGFGLRFGYRAVKGREGLGLGDVKFFANAGLWLGITGMVPFFLFSGLLGIATALLWRALGRGKIFPFGPALTISLGLCVIFSHITDIL